MAEQHVARARAKLAELVGDVAAVVMTPEQMGGGVAGGFGGLLKRLRCERRLTTSDIWDRLRTSDARDINTLLTAERAVACTLSPGLAASVLNVLAREKPLTNEEARDWALMTGESLAVVVVHGCAGRGRGAVGSGQSAVGK